MKIEKELLDDHQVKLTVKFDAEPFESAKHRAARKIAKRIKIPGFRPGKAPYGVILRTVGEPQVVESAIETLIEEQYPKIIEEAEIKPYGPGKLENVSELDPPVLEFVVPLDAEVELGDYHSIEIPFEEPETTEEDVQIAMDNIREQKASRENVERPAQTGDTVFLRISGLRKGKADEEDTTILEERFSSSIIREEPREDEFPFPGFSGELIGLSVEDEKGISHTFPVDYEQEDLQGAEVEYSVVVTNIQSMTLPEVDEDFVKENSDFETLEEWMSDLKQKLQEQARITYSEEYDNKILEQIVSESSLKYPPQMVENEINEMVRGLEYRLSQQGMTKELYLQVRGMDEEAFLEEIAPMAEERLKQALVLFEIAQKEEIEIDQDQVQSETLRTFDAISRQMTPNEAKKLTKSQFISNLMTNITVDMTTKTTLDYLRAMAKGEPWPPEDETPEENESIQKDEDDEIASDLETETEEESNQEIIEQGNTDEQTPSNDGEDDPVEE